VSELRTLFAHVLVPVPVPKAYTYRVPHDWNDWIHAGLRVAVQFGPKKIYAGIILELSDSPPEGHQASYLLDVLDDSPIVNHKQLQFWQWVSKYYMCYMGEVMATALPAGYRLQSETKILLHPDADLELVSKVDVEEMEWQILELLGKKDGVSLDEIHQKLAVKNVLKYVKSLYLRGLVVMEEELKENYRPKFEEFVGLSSLWEDLELANLRLNALERKAPKQYEAMMQLLGTGKREMALVDLTKGMQLDRTVLKMLEKKELVVIHKRRRDHLQVIRGGAEKFALTREQQQAKSIIQEAFDAQKPALLFGITGSGKTHVYMEFVKETLAKGKQVLYLLPEVALTEHLVAKMRMFIPQEMGVWHHFYSSHERTELYDKILKNQVQFVVGTKGAVFAPFTDLGLVVVDEEHEWSYKQFDKKPYYHGRDAAFQLAKIHGADLLMGSATPSYEMQYAVSQNRVAMAELHEKFDGGKPAELMFLHVGVLKKQGQFNGLFSDPAKVAIEKALELKQRVVVYHNRKGYVPYIECEDCGLTTQCKHCDISLTYYKSTDNQRCSYCGYQQAVPAKCVACGSQSLQLKGTGTEKLAEELSDLFPTARVGRFDQQSLRKRDDFQRILTAFERGEIDILVGTQLLAKGIDIENIGLVVVADTDMLLHIPDFRSHERAFQQLQQLLGRVGRRAERGLMMLQTHQPQHEVLRALLEDDYRGLMSNELAHRESFGYPPFTKLLKIDVKHADAQTATAASRWLAEQLKKVLSNNVLGPQVPSVARVKNRFIQQIVVKMPKEPAKVNAAKLLVHQAREAALAHAAWRAVRIDVVVDPI